MCTRGITQAFCVLFTLSVFAFYGAWLYAAAEGVSEAPLALTHNDSFRLMNARVEDDILVCRVGYGGGCAQHNFDTSWWSEPAEYNLKEVHVHLVHNANGDGCEAYISREVQFDLTAIRKSYQKQYQSAHGEISLKVYGVRANDIIPVVYKF